MQLTSFGYDKSVDLRQVWHDQMVIDDNERWLLTLIAYDCVGYRWGLIELWVGKEPAYMSYQEMMLQFTRVKLWVVEGDYTNTIVRAMEIWREDNLVDMAIAKLRELKSK